MLRQRPPTGPPPSSEPHFEPPRGRAANGRTGDGNGPTAARSRAPTGRADEAGAMPLRINSTILSNTAQRALASVSQRLSGSFRRLSTGLRINTAADDAAGLAISERLRAQVRSLDQARRNADDGLSLVQTAEGALSEVSNNLVRLRELAVQSANGTISSADRTTLDQEFQQLVDEINRIGLSTSFNGINLLDGSSSSVTFQVGPGTTTGVDTLNASLSPVLATGLGLDTLALTDVAASSTAMTAIDSAIDSLARTRGSFGAVQNRLQYTISNLSVQSESLAAAESRIRDVDVARETALLARDQVLQQATVAMLAQANIQPQLALRLISGQG